MIDARFEQALWPVNSSRAKWALVDLLVDLQTLVKQENPLVDIVVLSARRMACVFAIALQNGFDTGSHVQFLSDRHLEQNTLSWSGKKVLVIDDVVNSGATLSLLYKRANALVGPTGTVSAAAVCYNDDASRTDVPLCSAFAEPVSLPSNEIIEFASDLVSVFAQNLVPLITDFPVTQAQSVSSSELHQIMSVSNWETHDVRNSLILGSSAFTYSFVPPVDVFADQHVPDHLLSVSKVRMFTRADVNGIDVRFAPIVTLRPVTIASLRSFYQALGTEHLAGAVDPVSMIGYALSELLFERFRSDALVEFPDVSIPPFDTKIQQLYLGEQLYQDYYHAMAWAQNTDRFTSALALLERATPTHANDFSVQRHTDCSRVHVARDEDVEYIANHLVSSSKPVSSESLNLAHPERYVRGMPGLDILNDIGFAVPSNTVDDDIVRRTYTTGEISARTFAPGYLGGRFAAAGPSS